MLHAHSMPSPSLNWCSTGSSHPETVLLLHAVGHDLTYWDRQIEALSPAFNVLAPDLPGHGRSPGRPQDWSFPHVVDLLATHLESTGTAPVHLVGLSFGGMIAQHLALARPDLLRSLTLIGTAGTFSPAVRDGMRARAVTARTEGMQALIPSSLERWFTPGFRAARPDVTDRLTKTLLADDPLIHASIWDLIAGHHDTEARLPEIGCPTLVLVGEHDPSTPPSAARLLADRIPHARLTILPGASHIVPVESPAAVNRELLSFLTGLPR